MVSGTERRRLPREVREQQMLDAAVEVFSEYGFHEASMEEIAERARVSKPLLYLYLGSKEETFRACVARESDRLVDALRAMRTQAPEGGGPGYAAMRREAAAVAHALVGAADAMATWAVTNPSEAPQTTARRLMNLMWLGMERTAQGERFTGPGTRATVA
jgi:AcrR family transcriptional regulator